MVSFALQVPYILKSLQIPPDGSFAAVQLQDQIEILQGGSPSLRADVLADPQDPLELMAAAIIA